MENLYSFSGTDVDVYAFFPWNQTVDWEDSYKEFEWEYRRRDPWAMEEEILQAFETQKALNQLAKINSVITCSYQIHEPKAEVRALGHRAARGFSGSVRTIAGTLIFAVIREHPLAPLMNMENSFKTRKNSWSMDNETTGRGAKSIGGQNQSGSYGVATMLRPFNLYFRYTTERIEVVDNLQRNGSQENPPSFYNQPCNAMLIGVELISEGHVTSVNDLYTEVVFQFKALDIKNFSSGESPFSELVGTRSTTGLDHYYNLEQRRRGHTL